MRVQWGYSGGTGGVQWGYTRGKLGTQWGYSGGTVGIQEKSIKQHNTGILFFSYLM